MSEIHTEPSGYTWHWHGDLIRVYRPDGTFAGRVYRDAGPQGGTFYRAETGTDPHRCDWKNDREVTNHRVSVSEAVAALAYPPPPAPDTAA